MFLAKNLFFNWSYSTTSFEFIKIFFFVSKKNADTSSLAPPPLKSLESRSRRVNVGECDHRLNVFRIKTLDLVFAMANFTFICRARNVRS